MQTLELCLKKLICVDETNPEGNSDEILLSGTSVDATGDTHKLGTYGFNGLGDGDERNLGGAVFASFNFSADDIVLGKQTGWPRSYFVTFLLAEEDNGGFPAWVQKIYEQVKDEAISAAAIAVGAGFGGALGGAIGAAVGAVIGWVVAKLWDAFKEWWEDDPFPPVMSRCDVAGLHSSFGDDDHTSERWMETWAHGGRYRLEYEWRLRGVPSALGVFDPGSGGYLWRSDWKGFTTKWDEISKAGQRLVDVATYVDGDTRIYVGTFRAGSGGYHLHDLDWKAFEAKRNELDGKGFHLVGLDAYRAGTAVRAVGAFLPGKGKEVVVRGPWESFVDGWKQQSAAGMRLDRVTTYYDGKAQKFVGVFHEGTDGYVLGNGDWASFLEQSKKCHKDGLRLRDVATYLAGGTRMYVGAWRAGSHAQYFFSRADWVSFDKAWKSESEAGRRLVSIAV